MESLGGSVPVELSTTETAEDTEKDFTTKALRHKEEPKSFFLHVASGLSLFEGNFFDGAAT